MSKFCIGITLFICACSRPAAIVNNADIADQFRMTQFVIGSWNSESSNAMNYEIWTQVNDSTLSGRSYSISNKDTVSSENLRLVHRNGELAYIPTVSGQNDGLSVVFKLTSITDGTMTFENPGHDFPQTIKYERITADSIVAEISGMVKGERRTVQFPMRRSK